MVAGSYASSALLPYYVRTLFGVLQNVLRDTTYSEAVFTKIPLTAITLERTLTVERPICKHIPYAVTYMAKSSKSSCSANRTFFSPKNEQTCAEFVKEVVSGLADSIANNPVSKRHKVMCYVLNNSRSYLLSTWRTFVSMRNSIIKLDLPHK